MKRPTRRSRRPARARKRVRPPASVAAAILAATALAAGPLAAQEHRHEDHPHEESRGGGLHFRHPLIAESVSPDTKLRLDHQYFDFPDGDREHSAVLEAEYAFHRSFSIEAGLPFSYTEGEIGNLEVALKLANYSFEGSGILLGAGLEVGFPTAGSPDGEPHAEPVASLRPGGSRGAPVPGPAARPAGAALSRSSGDAGGVAGTLGSDEWEIAPFLNAGLRLGRLELVAWTFFEIPFRQAEGEEPAAELAYNLSALVELSDRLEALLEVDGAGGISGEAVGEDVVHLSPGLRFRPVSGAPLVVGSSVGFPLTEEKPFDLRWKTSVFWHFAH